jgi:hypothetical protein
MRKRAFSGIEKVSGVGFGFDSSAKLPTLI